MTEAEEIEQNMEFLEDLREFVQSRVNNVELASGAVCSLTLVATQMAYQLSERDMKQTRDMMVGAINLGLKHGLK